MIPYLLEDQKFNLPGSYHELTVKQWFGLHEIDVEDVTGLLELLTGIPKATWLYTRQIDIVDQILPNLKWLRDPIDLKNLPVPKKIIFNGAEIKTPTDLRLETNGQKITFQQQMIPFIDEAGNISINFLPIGIAIYLCPKPAPDQYKTFDLMTEVEKLIPEVEKLFITDAYPLIAFFLMSSQLSLTSNRSTSKPTTLRSRFRQALRTLKSTV